MNQGASQSLIEAASQVRLDHTDAVVVRAGENQIYRLPGRVIARIAPPGQEKAATREIFIARWLNSNGVQAVEPLDVDIATANWLSGDDSDWVLEHLDDLEDRWTRRHAGMPESVVHGDAWVGNVVDVEGAGVTMLDLERCSVGPPEWDLTSVACRFTTYSTLSAADYADYCDEYGFDVTAWDGFPLLRDIRELRVTCYAAYVATANPQGRPLAQTRVDCLRGKNGRRPWHWPPLN